MKYCIFLCSFLLIVSCTTDSNENSVIDRYYHVGTTSTMYGISPYPDNKLWVDLINNIALSAGKKTRGSILWSVGSYSKNGINMSFPGEDSKDIYYDKIDYNEETFSLFDKEKIDVFLLIEPSSVNVDEAIYSSLNKYMRHKSVVGVCVDLEWFDRDIILSEEIKSWLLILNSFNKSYKLMIKHWNINKIEPFIHHDIIYVQSMEGINNIDEIKKRYSLWARAFYPCSIGLEVGFPKDNFWVNYDNPIQSLYSEIDGLSLYKSSIYWCESTLLEYP